MPYALAGMPMKDNFSNLFICNVVALAVKMFGHS
jgi:hypothetical protein